MYNALVIGAGFMGSKKDSLEDDKVFTHGKSYYLHPKFNLVGFVDTNLEEAKKAASIWGGKGFTKLKSACASSRIDVVSVVTPDQTHFDVLADVALLTGIKHIFCEKPLAPSFILARGITNLFSWLDISGSVNYTRRYLPEIDELRLQISRGDFGSYLFSQGYFGNGLIHDGSHMVDLLLYLLGTYENFSYNEIDSSLYRIFELDIFFEKKRIRLTDFTWQLEYQTTGISPFYNWQTHINHEKTVQCRIDRAIYNAIDNIANYLDGKEDLKCTFRDACNALEACECLMRKN
jgi:predicted dehydrogenase